ncbi:FHA domain-containing protein [bacterium]|nr:FHA domain-containing protein [bacterium]
MKKTFLFLLFGAIGGFIGWIILEPLPLTHMREKTLIEVYRNDAIFGAVMGFFIGGSLGLTEAIWRKQRLLGFTVIGSLTGLLGGACALVIGERIYQMFVPGEGMASLFQALKGIVARSLGWSAVGMVVGASQGILTLSKWRAKRGALGGAFGGFIGGMLFDFLPFIFYTDAVSRMVALTSIGGLVGFSTSLVEELTKKAWLKVLSGSKEGREYIVDKDEFYIGRDELCDLGLFGDKSVLPKHALITRKDNTYEIRDLGGGVILNGQRISSATLQDGDRLQIGGHSLLFQMKEKVQRRDVVVEQKVSPVSSDVCPYCGQRKDPITGACACTPATQPSALKAGQTAVLPSKQEAKPLSSGARLVVVKGPLEGEVFPIMKEEFTIGRAEDRDLTILDKAVSRRHCKIVLEDDGYYILDEGSTNGTFVSGMRVAREKLKNGDIIQVGESKLRFEI